MIFARRVGVEDEYGEVATDFEGIEVPRSAKRSLPASDLTPHAWQRSVKMLAIQILRKAGMDPSDIALAVDYSERHVWRQLASARDLRESADSCQGRP